MITPYKKNLKDISRNLRRRPTEAERYLWKKLRLKHLGYIFHRQKPIGGYIADFYCPKTKLVIEVDGDYHLDSETAGNDKVRDEVMYNLGMNVLRFYNSDVLNDVDQVVNKMKNALSTTRDNCTTRISKQDNAISKPK